MQKSVNPIEVYQIEFWPHWNPEGTGNSKYVEPDVFIETEDFNVIVEAKRGDDSGQGQDQWQKEIKAYQNEYSDYADKKVYFLAVGGNPNEEPEELNEIPIFKLSWNRLLTNVQQQIKVINDSNNVSSKVLERLSRGMSIFGYYNYHWFHTWELRYALSNYALAIEQFNRPEINLMHQYKISDKYLNLLV